MYLYNDKKITKVLYKTLYYKFKNELDKYKSINNFIKWKL